MKYHILVRYFFKNNTISSLHLSSKKKKENISL